MTITIRKTFKGDVKSEKKERNREELGQAFKDTCREVKEGDASACRLCGRGFGAFKRIRFDKIEGRFTDDKDFEKKLTIWNHAFSNFLDRNKRKDRRIWLYIDYLDK